MARRALIILIALALAVAGTWIILTWVNSAVDRELEPVALVEVLVSTEAIRAGTPADDLVLGEDVQLVEVLARSQIPGALVTLDDISGLVADVDIVAGEQLTTQRWVDPATRFASLLPEVEIPDGFLEVSFGFNDAQFVGGKPQPGDTVAFIATFDPFTISPTAIEPGAVDDFDDLFAIIQQTEVPTDEDAADVTEFKTPNTTHILFHKLLVTNVQFGEPPALVDDEGNPVQPDPRAEAGVTIVTFAAPAPDIERMVFTHEFGRIWLALEPIDAPEGGTDFITRGNVFP